jgi:hypothetical protein
VARIILWRSLLGERVEALRKASAVASSRPAKPTGKVSGTKTVADQVVENRE